MFNFFTIVIALAALFVGILSAVYGPRIVKSIKEVKEERRIAREVQEDLEAVEKDRLYTTADGHAEVRWKNGALLYVCLKGGHKYDSFEELFRNEKMEMSTHEELENVKRRLENTVRYIEENMYKPKFRTEYNTEKELGRKLYVYRTGELMLSDRIMVSINKINGEMIVTGALVGAHGLKSSDAIRVLDFIVTDENPQEQVDKYLDVWMSYLSNPEYEDEAKMVEELQEHFEFYNSVIRDGQVTFSGGKIFIKAPQVLKPDSTDSKPSSLHKRVDDALKSAERFESVSK